MRRFRYTYVQALSTIRGPERHRQRRLRYCSDPATDDHLYVMATMLPLSPLQSDSVYTATMTVSWGGDEETFTSTFQTAR